MTTSVIIIDPAHDVDKISRTVAGRTVEKILLTHAHDDHIRSAKEAAGTLRRTRLPEPRRPCALGNGVPFLGLRPRTR